MLHHSFVSWAIGNFSNSSWLQIILREKLPTALQCMQGTNIQMRGQQLAQTLKSRHSPAAHLERRAAMQASTSPARAIDFLSLVQSLKLFKRTGWIRKGVSSPESIADHMYRMSLMALVAGDAGVDSNRCIKLAIAHDLAEAIVGDIAPGDGVSKTEKNRRETAAMEQIRDLLGVNSFAGIHVQQLWQEYEDAETPEAKLVKDFDKIEMILQAHEYEQAQGSELQEFFDSTAGKFQTDLGKAWAAEIVSRRQQAASQ